MLLLITPFLFKNQIMELAKTELNKMLMARVDFKDLKLSFIRNFPSAYVALDGLEVTGVDDFEDELLVAFDRFSVTVDIMSVIRMKNIEVKSILLDRARLNGHILEDGRANWDIVKPGEEKKEVVTEKKEAAPAAFKVALKKFEIRDMHITFRDEVNNMIAEVQSLNYILRGDMTQDNADLNMELGIEGIDFWMGGIRLANKAGVGFISEIAADLKNMFFLIKDNRFNLNDIVLKFDGSVGLQEDDINVDITFATERTDFKSLLSLVPAIYMNDFEDVRTAGSLALNGEIKGPYNEKTMPSANVELVVDNAMFSYPALPKSVNNINIDVKAHYDGEVFDRTTLDVDKINFEMAGNPFYAELHVKTPESDMQVSARFAGKIDFNSVAAIVPLDDITLNGLLDCDITLSGRMSMIENERYEDFYAEGNLKINGFNFVSSDFPQGVKITSTQLHFTPRKVDLTNFDAIIGRSDIAMNGSLENFIPFIFKNDTIRGTLALRSNTIDLNEFMGGEPKETDTVQADAAPLSVIEVPKNIDFAMTVNIGNILFDKLDISNTTGAILVKDGRLIMQNLGMNLLEGSMTLNGEYNTQNIALPFVDFDMNIRQFDISSAISSFSMIEKILTEPQNYTGKVSASLVLNSVLDEHLSPVLDKVNSKGRLQTQNLEIHNSKLFGTMADLLKNESWRSPAPGNINIGFEIKDGRVWIQDPIVMNMPPAKVELIGDIGLDTTLNYRMDAIVPTSAVGSNATNILGNIPGGSTLKEIKVAGLIRGTVKDPDIRLSVADMAGNIVGAVRDQVTETVTQKVEEVRTQVNEEINRQIDAIMAEAQKQADNIRSTAKQAADRVRKEANAAADKLASDTAEKSAIEKRLAQAAADSLRSEGESNAKKLEQEGENQAQAAMTAAQKKADELKRN
ncbi:MAG: AsmA family protein [Treponema sp.]|nr:AsmA family protein [Treponema sp.]